MKSEMNHYLFVGLVFIIIACVRYLVMTGTYYLVVYKIFQRKLYKYKINKTIVPTKIMLQEAKWALFNNINFGILGVFSYIMWENGMLKIYTDVEEYGLFYTIAMIPILLVLHDAYFFWSHYLMHKSPFNRWTRHDVHHHFHNVSPWSAFSVHPFEGFVEVLFRPLTLMVIPMHPSTIIAFAFISFTLNIIGHSGYEFFPKGFASSPFTKAKSCATFHYLHHRNGKYNLSLFFNFWDRIMGTLHPDYVKFYEETTKDRKLQLPQKIDFKIFNPKTWINLKPVKSE